MSQAASRLHGPLVVGRDARYLVFSPDSQWRMSRKPLNPQGKSDLMRTESELDPVDTLATTTSSVATGSLRDESAPGLSRYRNLHYWMLFPFAITVLGFAPRYFLAFPEATFHQHVHGISATLWFVLIIIQPWLVTRAGRLATHRSLGIIGLVLAGTAAGSALAIIPRNINNIESLPLDGIFTPTFAYFATYLDALLISLFMLSVTLAVLKIKRGQVADHVQWLLASVFFILSPALIRLITTVAIVMNSGNIEGIQFMNMILPSGFLMLVMIGIYYYRFGSFRHPSFLLLMLSLASFFLAGWVGDNETLRSLAHAIFKI
jgi:hypothetical protein